MNEVAFSVVAVDLEFNERPECPWHLKVGNHKGMYDANGVRAEPTFRGDEVVFVSETY